MYDQHNTAYKETHLKIRKLKCYLRKIMHKKSLLLLKVSFFNLLLLAVLLPAIEIILRNSGSLPGLIVDAPPFLAETDSLILFQDYTADESGIMKFSESGRLFVKRKLAHENPPDSNNYNILKVLANHFIMFNKNIIDNAFSKFIGSLKKKDHPDEVEQAYIDYCSSPVNSDGFRSIEFCNYNTGKVKVMLLGDSHTFGAEASNLTSSFSDELATEGYVVFNTGIVNTDPAQYLAVARKYVPRIKPDIVILNFCFDNDIVYHKREVKPYQMMFFHTNLTNISACPYGEYLSTPQESYEYIMKECYIPNQDISTLNKLCAKSVIATRLWIAVRRIGFLTSYPYSDTTVLKRSLTNSGEPVVDYYIEEVKKVCDQNEAAFILAGIPDGDDPDKLPQNIPGLFEKFTCHIANLTSDDWAPGRVHMNDMGHTKYASFLQQLIENRKTESDFVRAE